MRWLNVRFRDAAEAFETTAAIISCLLFHVRTLICRRYNHADACRDVGPNDCHSLRAEVESGAVVVFAVQVTALPEGNRSQRYLTRLLIIPITR
jgi:hypothetical protein